MIRLWLLVVAGTGDDAVTQKELHIYFFIIFSPNTRLKNHSRQTLLE